jgi:hypothetical protein
MKYQLVMVRFGNVEETIGEFKDIQKALECFEVKKLARELAQKKDQVTFRINLLKVG